MRTKILALGTVALALAATAFSRPASKAPQPSHAVSSITDIRTDSSSAVASSELFRTLQELRRAEDAYFGANGQYTADRHALTGYTPMPGADVFVTAGPDWFVIKGEVRGVTVQQLTVWRADRAPVTSGAFSAE